MAAAVNILREQGIQGNLQGPSVYVSTLIQGMNLYQTLTYLLGYLLLSQI